MHNNSIIDDKIQAICGQMVTHLNLYSNNWIRQLEENPKISFLIIDDWSYIKMCILNIIEILDRIKEIRPDIIRIIILSSDNMAANDYQLAQKADILISADYWLIAQKAV